MKITTICGTRPELIRLSRIISKLDECCDHTLIWTGQNFEPKLSDIFFADLGIRKPDVTFPNKSGNFGEQIGLMFCALEQHLIENRPDKVLILGDTNSGLCSIVCERFGIPVYHLESGNRCGDKKVFEEINRKIIDHTSTINLPYTSLSKENLIKEGIAKDKIYVVGNPIGEVLKHYEGRISQSKILNQLRLTPGRYYLTTFHRGENVNNETTLKDIVRGLEMVAEKFKLPIICSIHPKTQSKIEQFKILNSEKLKFLEPLGFFDFAKLEQHAKCLISDSGTVPEEGCLFGIPSVIIRKTTERPELIQCGSAMISGTNSEKILEAVTIMRKYKTAWQIPEEYTYNNVSDRVTRIILGNI